MKLIPGYALFYLEGREEKLIRADIDTAEIARQVIESGGTIHERLHEAASKAAEPLRVDRKKRQWLEDYEDDIKAMGGNSDHAYDHYLEGRVDELVGSLEGEVVDEMTALVHGEEEDEDDDGEDDNEDEEEE